MINVVLANYTGNWYHWGCAGTSHALLERLQALNVGVVCIPAYETYKGPWENRPETINDFMSHDTFDRFASKNISLIETIGNADALVINGEGTIHGLRFPALNLLYLAYAAKKMLNKHVEIIHHSVYPQDSIELSQTNFVDIYQMVYQVLDYVAVREPFSLKLLEKMEISASLSFDCLPLYIKNNYLKKKTQSSRKIVIGGSAAWTASGMTAMCQYFNEMYQLGFELQFLVGAPSYLAEDDIKLMQFLEKQLANGTLQLKEAKSIDEWLDAIADAQLLVSGRFHYTLAAACLGTSFIALNSNTPKIDALLNMIDIPEVSLAYDDPNLLKKLKSNTQRVLSSKENMDDLVKKRTEKLCGLADNNFKAINKFVSTFQCIK